MRRTAGLAALVAGLAGGLAGCGDIGAPLRTDTYEWRRIQGTDTLSFHWPQAFLPVRIWAEPTDNLPAYADSGIAAWNRVFLYNEYRAIRVDDSTTAHVIIREGPLPPGNDILLGGGALERSAPECQAATLPNIDQVRQAHLPMHIYISPRFSPTLPATQACLALTLTHELGHTIGIFNHSPYPDDLMYADPVVAAPSERDRNTDEILYHMPANVVPVPGP